MPAPARGANAKARSDRGGPRAGKRGRSGRAAAARRQPPLEQRILQTATLCLLAFGAVMVYSASSASALLQGEGNGSGELIKFVIYGALGLGLMHYLARDGLAR
ncbi:MAG TPA: hypothetical protein VMS02_08680, partial [Solirubrobacteraceae bacterium]|nr:hypothetical protein [Solirubrobacteraceae bacterium]